MKTRWMSVNIAEAFDPGTEKLIEKKEFSTKTDPRSAPWKNCLDVFTASCKLTRKKISDNTKTTDVLDQIRATKRVPYEFPIAYEDAAAHPHVHTGENLKWCVNKKLEQLMKARKILENADGLDGKQKEAVKEIINTKIKVKLFLTDRSLTGEDKTNRAKRWEVLEGDYQHATKEECWEAERKITLGLLNFEGFPDKVRDQFVEDRLIKPPSKGVICPVTFESLSFKDLCNAILKPTHGASPYEIGHIKPLKKDGKHDGRNVCWMSAAGNRIQHDMTIEETHKLLQEIEERRKKQK